MNKITGYFAVEKYLGWRLLLLVFGGVLVIILGCFGVEQGAALATRTGFGDDCVRRVRRRCGPHNIAERKGEVPSLLQQEYRYRGRRDTQEVPQANPSAPNWSCVFRAHLRICALADPR